MQIITRGSAYIFYGFLLCTLSLLFACQNELHFENKVEKNATKNVTLRIYNWEEYLGQQTLRQFTKQTGIKIDLSTFADLDIMISRLQSDPSAFDVIFPSRYRLCGLLELKLLAPLDLNKLPNRKNIDPNFLKLPCDPNGQYFVPYLMGTTGIAYDRTKYPEGVSSWNELLNPHSLANAAFLNNADEVLSIGLKVSGTSINSNDPNELRRAGNMLRSVAPGVRGFMDPRRSRDLLIAGELEIAHSYSGEAVFAGRRNKNIEYAIPQEGCSMWVDLMAVPAEARNKEAAMIFINYMLEPQVNADCASYLGYGTPNVQARKLLPDKMIHHPAINPPAEQLAKCEFFENIEQSRAVRNQIWESLKRR